MITPFGLAEAKYVRNPELEYPTIVEVELLRVESGAQSVKPTGCIGYFNLTSVSIASSAGEEENELN